MNENILRVIDEQVLFDEFENIFKKSFYKDKTDAIEYAKEKRKIKSQGEKQLPLINN